MENIPEIDLKLETKKVGEYNIDDMIQMFGDRIKPAIHENENGGKGLIIVEMRKLFRKWKTNADIKAAYRHYYGYILVPWVIVNNPPIILYDSGAMKQLKKEIINRYKLADGS